MRKNHQNTVQAGILCGMPGWFCAVLLAGGMARADARTELDLTRLAEYSAATARLAARAECPPAFSTDPERESQINAALARLLEHGAPRAAGILVVDGPAVREVPMPAEPRLVPRLLFDMPAGRLVAGPELADAEAGVSAGAWFFYNNFAAAYAGLHPEFRRADSPLARGAAALAALGNSRRGNLALLPAFRPEAALAALLCNADPELPDALRAQSPAEAALRARVSAAMRRAGIPADAGNVEHMLGRFGDVPAIPMLDARRLVPARAELRAALWRFAVENIAYPGLLAEIGAWLWVGRTPDQHTAVELDAIAERRMLDVIERDLRARGIPTDAAARQAAFDIAQAPAVFAFIWAVTPECMAWRRAVSAAAAIPDEPARTAQMLELKNQLAAMLEPGSDAAIAPAARLCAMLGAPPTIELELVPRDQAGGMMARLTIIWKTARPVPGGADSEEARFTGAAAMVLFDSIAELEGKRITFVAAGLDAATGAARAGAVRFNLAEMGRFDDALKSLRREFNRAQWNSSRARQPERLARLLVLCFAGTDAADQYPADFIAAWLRPGVGGRPPAWLAALFDEYLAARAAFLEKGDYVTAMDWVRRYMPLLALAFELDNDGLGDALARDFFGVAVTLILGENPDQPGRAAMADANLRAPLDDAWHWSRDVIAIVRDAGDGRQAWFMPDGWDDLLREALPDLTASGAGEAVVRRADDAVELGNLWVQIRKIRQGPADADDAGAIRAALDGAGAYRFSWLLAAPSQNAVDLYTLAPFGQAGPHAGRGSLRAVLGLSGASAE